MKVRRLKVVTNLCDARLSWRDAELRVTEFAVWGSGKPSREVVVVIRNPDDLRYIRERLDEIEAHWREALGT